MQMVNIHFGDCLRYYFTLLLLYIHHFQRPFEYPYIIISGTLVPVKSLMSLSSLMSSLMSSSICICKFKGLLKNIQQLNVVL